MLTFHLKGILSLQKHYTVQRHLPTGTASIQPILQMNQLGLREIGSGTVETPSLRLQLARIFYPPRLPPKTKRWKTGGEWKLEGSGRYLL